jgi:hypothetical protein
MILWLGCCKAQPDATADEKEREQKRKESYKIAFIVLVASVAVLGVASWALRPKGSARVSPGY